MKLIRNRRKFFVLLLLIIFLSIMFIPYKLALVFAQPEKGTILGYIPISAEKTFKIKYVHSIHLSDVIESYQITSQNEIQQYELEFEDLAVGMPSEAEKGEVFEVKDGKYLIRNMERTFDSFILRLGQVRANHTLVYKKHSYPLTNVIEPGTRVLVKVEKISMIQQMKGVNIIEHKK